MEGKNRQCSDTATENIEIFCDGAFDYNHSIGGWGVVIKNGCNIKRIAGYKKCEDSTQAEIIALVKALLHLTVESAMVSLHTDSKIIRLAICNSFLNKWKKSGRIRSYYEMMELLQILIVNSKNRIRVKKPSKRQRQYFRQAHRLARRGMRDGLRRCFFTSP